MRSRLAAAAIALALFSAVGLSELHGHGWAFDYKHPTTEEAKSDR